MAQTVKNLQCGRARFDPWVRKIPWKRKWQPTPVLLPERPHGWRSLVGYSPWGRKELDMAERLHFHFSQKQAYRLSPSPPTGLSGCLNGKESTCHAGDAGDQSSIPGSGRSPGEGNGNSLQYSCLGNPTDRGAWQATVLGVTKSWTRLSD